MLAAPVSGGLCPAQILGKPPPIHRAFAKPFIIPEQKKIVGITMSAARGDSAARWLPNTIRPKLAAIIESRIDLANETEAAMSASKVIAFGHESGANTFFFKSPFRSWKFLVNTVLLVTVSVGSAIVVWKCCSFPVGSAVFVFLMMNVIHPYWFALRRHGSINELYLSGQISEQPAKSPLNQLLEVADNSINEGLRNASFLFGLFLLVMVFWKFHPLK